MPVLARAMLVTTTAILLAACSGTATQNREAAQAPTPATPSPVTAATNPVDATITNLTRYELFLECRSPEKNVEVPAGDSVTLTGHASTFSTRDDFWCKTYAVSESSGEAEFDITVKNPLIGRPDAGVGTNRNTFSVGDSWETSHTVVQVNVKREADSQNGHKSFTFTVRR